MTRTPQRRLAKRAMSPANARLANARPANARLATTIVGRGEVPGSSATVELLAEDQEADAADQPQPLPVVGRPAEGPQARTSWASPTTTPSFGRHSAGCVLASSSATERPVKRSPSGCRLPVGSRVAGCGLPQTPRRLITGPRDPRCPLLLNAQRVAAVTLPGTPSPVTRSPGSVGCWGSSASMLGPRCCARVNRSGTSE